MIDYIINIFTKPMIRWSFIDYLIIVGLFIILFIIVALIVYGIQKLACYLDTKKKKRCCNFKYDKCYWYKCNKCKDYKKKPKVVKENE